MGGPWTALQTALNYGHVPLAEYLVERGADIDVHAAAGLGWAIVAGSVNLVELLLQRGAEKRDYYEREAEDGVKGAFMEFKNVDLENYDKILTLLRRT